MRKEYMEISGETFEIKKAIDHYPSIKRRTLLDCYGRPSQYKQAIYDYWLEWAYQNNTMLAINSYNSMMFTLHGLITIDEKDYYYYITKTRQELYPIL